MLAALLLAVPPSAAQAQDAAAVTIMDVQGEGHLSPLVGQTVTVQGVVTAAAFRGFYMQDQQGDHNDATSDGIFVFTGGDTPAVGDEVSVTGPVSEFVPGGATSNNLSITQLSGDVNVLSSGNRLPRPVQIGVNHRFPSSETVISESELPTNLQTDPAVFNPEVDAIDFYETLEGMYVKVDRPVATSAVRQFNPFSAEFFAVPSNGRTVSSSDHRTQRGGLLLQPDVDNRGDQNPERIQIQFDGTIYPGDTPQVEVGDKFRDVVGVLGYSFGNYEVNATELLDQRRDGGLHPEFSRLRPQNRKVTVASYNVLNLSADASDDAQRAKLADQIVWNLNAPDVLALQEIQDNSGELDDGTTAADQTLQALVDAIVAAGGPSYSFVDFAPADGTFGGIPGGNIRNAFLYNTDRVELLDTVSLSPALLAEVGAPNANAFDGSRSPLAGLFSFRGTPFTVVNVHDTSRFGSSPIFGAVQPFIQAGEQAREDQAAALNAFTQAIVGENHDAIVMVAGDFNTFEWTDDLAWTLPGEYGLLTNLLTTDALLNQDRRDRYTFIFEGNSQALDHFFVTENLAWQPQSRLDIVHVNVDFSRLLSDVVASDHEPLLGRFRLPEASGPFELPRAEAADTFTLQVLHASDLEGGVDALDRATNFAAIVDRLEDNPAVDASVTISAGDNYIPGPFFGASGDRSLREVFQAVYQELTGDTGLTNIREAGGRGDVTIMNIIGFDASALGNHEFDAGTDALESIIEEDVRGATSGDIRWLGADFPYLSANLDFSLDPDLQDLFTADLLENTAFSATPAELAAGANPPKIAPSTFITVDGDERIGVVGATTQLLASISSPGATSVIGPDNDDMFALAGLLQPQIDALEAQGINKIVLTSHLQQLALEEQLATLLDGVDIIIAGGSDSLLANDDDELRGGDFADREYPVAAVDAAGDPVAIVSTDGEYSYVGQLVVDFDANGVLQDLDSLDTQSNGPIKTEIAEVDELWGSLAQATAPGTKANLVQTLVDAIRGVVIAKDGNVVGESIVFLDGRRSQVRTQETNFGNLSADANLATAQAFDPTVVLSIKNGGGIRSAIGVIDSDGNLLPPPGNPATGKLDGQISQLDLENSLRFNNGLTLLTLTGDELAAVIEHAVAATEPGATPGQFAQIGGAQFLYDSLQPPGSRVVSLVLLDANGGTLEQVIANGDVTDPTATYRIVTLNFLAGGGDSYPFDALAAPDRVDLTDVLTDVGASLFAAPGSEQDALAEFLIANHGVGAGTPYAESETPAGQDGRIVDLVTVGNAF
jgi:2',3'-cyclic-nucleotide 2'-phosphodiesterase (5'-nucleotidase family)